MKLPAERSALSRRCKPFLVLPSLSPDRLDPPCDRMAKKPGLKLFTKTWPPRRDAAREDRSRPLTATLEKPTILDIKFVGKIDMSKVRKEFLNISNLCRLPLVVKRKPTKSKICRPLSLPATANGKSKKKRTENADDSADDEESSRSSGRRSVSRRVPPLPRAKPAKVSSDANNNTAAGPKPAKVSGDANNNTAAGPKLGKASGDANNNTAAGPKLGKVASDANNNTAAGLKPAKVSGDANNNTAAGLKPAKVSGDANSNTAAGPKLGKVSGDANNNTATGVKPAKVAGDADSKAVAAPKAAKVVASDAGRAGRGARRAPALVAAPPSTKLPEPCTTCGRPDQPERFHSHPSAGTRSARRTMPKEAAAAVAEKVPVKSTVQKPVAIKYKSKQNGDEKKPTVGRKPSLPSQVLVHTPPAAAGASEKPPAGGGGRLRSAKRTLTCYICGREFGTASLPLHEPKCLERFHRENASLPFHLRRKLPPKPDGTVSQEEWNKLAWESSQSTLTPCANCGRTFFPDRLVVHQRSCKTPQHNLRRVPPVAGAQPPPPAAAVAQRAAASADEAPPPNAAAQRQPPSVECYVCGRQFGKHSVAIHERQCLRKWHQENDALPPDMRSAPPVKGDGRLHPPARKERTPEATAGPPAPRELSETERPSTAGRRPPLFPCYLCGKLFSVHSIYLHEPQCLKRWQAENEKLPPGKRRPVPLKPDVKFTQKGTIDFAATNEANWQSHLSQLVGCKYCSRTFNPDRVAVHERSCKGN